MKNSGSDNRTRNTIIVLILIIIILCLIIGLLLLVNSNENGVNNEVSTTTSTLSTSVSTTKLSENVFSEYPANNDDDVIEFTLFDLVNDNSIDLKTNFQNVSINKYGLDYTVTCTNFDESNIDLFGYGCSKYKINIGDLIFEEFQDEGCGHTKNVLKINDYLIIQSVMGCDEGCGNIDIYDGSRLLYTVKGTQVLGIKGPITADYLGLMKYKNGKLYYFVTPDENHIALKTIDLNSDNIVEQELRNTDYDYVSCVNRDY